MPEKLLSRKHQAFIDEYLRTFNGTQAYMRVYPKSTPEAARANAARLLATDNVRAEVTARLAEAHMSADEALKLLADQARGDIAEVFDISSVGFNVDMQKAQKQGKTKLIRKVKQKTTIIAGKGDDDGKEIHEVEVELYDAQAAIDKILRVQGKYKDVGSADNPLSVVMKRIGVDVDRI